MIAVQNIYKNYGQLAVLKGVNLTINKGEMVSIVGSSGAGKSTLLHIMGTLDTPDSGSLLFNDQQVNTLNAKALAAFRNKHIGFVFQFHHLLPEFTAWENICMPAWIAKTNKKQAKDKALELLQTLGLSNKANNKPSELSGGEQQRVAVARALINNPDIVLADEPTGNLDSQNAKEMHNLFVQLNQTLQQSFVIVTHNQELASLCQKTYTMKDGVIV